MNKVAVHRRAWGARSQRGLSLVELMVGVAVGLFVVAAAAMLVANQLSDNRRLLLETQLQQDIRASMDIITRQLRRAGALDTVPVQQGLSTSPTAGGAWNPFTDVVVTNPGGTAGQVDFKFILDPSQNTFGFKLEDGALKTWVPRVGLAGGNWQELTDKNSITVTEFKITPRIVQSSALPCPKLCSDGSTDCWPQLVLREYTVEISARSRTDASVQRSLRNDVRLRNDLVQFNDPAAPAPAPTHTLVCPA